MIQWKSINFACLKCITGHRPWSCQHLNRPVTEVKPKGRPSSQCTTCKSKRQGSGSHHKCKCGEKPVLEYRENVQVTFKDSELVLSLSVESLPFKDLETAQSECKQTPETTLNVCDKSLQISQSLLLQIVTVSLIKEPLPESELERIRNAPGTFLLELIFRKPM